MGDLRKENLMLKIALCKMVRHFMYRTTVNGVEFFDNFCESAGEKAFESLGFKKNLVKVKEIENLEEQLGKTLLTLNKYER